MKLRMKSVISWVLALALVLGCAGGGGTLTAKASETTGEPKITKVEVSPDPVADGGQLTVTVTGENLEAVQYDLRYLYKPTGLYNHSVYGEGTLKNGEFTLTMPANASAESDTWRIAVLDKSVTPAYTDWDKAEYSAVFSVKSKDTDKSALKKAIEEAGALKEDDYSAKSWQAFQVELNKANSVDAKENATQDEVDEAVRGLEAAIKGLVANVVISGVTADPAELSAEGGKVTLTVTGTGMTDENWGVDVERYYSGSDMEVSGENAGDVESIAVKGNQAEIQITENRMKNDIDFKFSVGPKSGDSIIPSKSVTVTQKARAYGETKDLMPESVDLYDNYTITVAFAEDITLSAYKQGDALKKLFYITENGAGGTKRTLTGEDTVEVEGNVVTIRFKDPVIEEKTGSGGETLHPTLWLTIEMGALQLVAGNVKGDVLSKISHVVSTTPRVSTIAFDKEVLTSEGGTVKATLDGYKVEDIDVKSSQFTASVIQAGTTKEVEGIVVQKSTDEPTGKPVLTFDLPANETKSTISYYLNIKNDVTPVYGTERKPIGIVSVLPAGKKETDQTLGALTITGNNKDGELSGNSVKDIVVNVTSAEGALKADLRLYGTNLDAKLTKARAIDENGIIWPFSDIPQCDGTWRFHAIAGINKNGVFGDGNAQLIEVLPPRCAGTNKKYTIQVSLDGKTFLTEPVVTLQVNNASIAGEEEFRDCSANNFKYITVKYVEEGTNRELAKADVYKGYCISEPKNYPIAPKEIPGYKLVKEPNPLKDEFINEGRTYTYVYRSLTGSSAAGSNVRVNGIQINAISKNLAAGKKVKLDAVITPANAANKKLTWKSSNTKYATVDANGTVSLKKAGAGKKVTITATAADGSGKSGSITIKIMKNAVKKVTLKAKKSVKAGKSVKVKATVKTTGKKVNKKLKWTSSNPAYATVNGSGKVKTYKAGKGKTVKITATATDGSGRKKTIKIKLK